MLTHWGYTLTDLDSLPAMLSENEFAVFTANKYAGDVRIPAEIRSACSAIRDYVGWHLYPSASCKLEEYILHENGRVKLSGGDLFIQLPAVFVTTVTSVMIGENETTDYALETNGILHVFDVNPWTFFRKTKITVVYIAGVSESMLDGIQELIAHRVTHALAVPPGVTTEAAGGVSITYNANWANNVRATALPDDNKEVLSAYRVQGVF